MDARAEGIHSTEYTGTIYTTRTEYSLRSTLLRIVLIPENHPSTRSNIVLGSADVTLCGENYQSYFGRLETVYPWPGKIIP